MEPENDTSINEQEVADALQLELERLEAEARALKQKKDDAIESLGQKITSEYQARRGRRGTKEQQWLLATRLKLGNIASTKGFSDNPDAPFENPELADNPERNIVYTKTEIAKAQLYSMQFTGGEKNWDLLPPEDSEELQALGITNIAERCEKMEQVMAGQLEKSRFERELLAAIDEYVVLGTGILKGPTNSSKMYRTYVPTQLPDGNRIWTASIAPRAEPCVEHRSVWYIFPDDSTNKFSKAENVIELHPMSRNELADLAKHPGFMAEKVKEAIELGPDPSNVENSTHFTALSDTGPMVFKGKYAVLEWHGEITSDQLEDLDIQPSTSMPNDKYFAEVWVCNGIVIRIELANIEGCTKPPYSAVVWLEDPSSPFGFGIPHLLRDSQRVVNTAWDMILTNSSQSSAPQVVVDEDAVRPMTGEYELNPGKFWRGTDSAKRVSDIFQFFIVPNVTDRIFPVMETAKQGSEEESGIAMIAAGMESGQVTTDTATGRAIQQKASTVLLELKSNDIDEYLTEPRYEALYDWNMQYHPDDSIKAPMSIRIRSATEYGNKQMYIRDLEKLSVEASQNPVLGEVINMDLLTQDRLNMMNLPNRGIVKSQEQIQIEREEAAKNPPPPSPDELKYQVEMARLELEKERLAIEKEKIAYQREEGQRKEAMEYEERMVNTYARIAEAESQLAKSQNEKEIAYLQIAARAETDAERNAITSQVAVMNEETKRILAGMQHVAKSRDQLLTERELNLAERTGDGI